MSIPRSPYFHGSSADSVDAIIQNGIDMRRVQARDDGFFGEGFYVANTTDIAMQHATTISSTNPAIVAIDISSKANILYAGETFADGSVAPTRPPSWHAEFIDWNLQKVENAAVWEYATDKSREEILESARASRTPGTAEFERQRWYKDVTAFAEENGYDIVYWTDGEIIIKTPSIVTSYERVD